MNFLSLIIVIASLFYCQCAYSQEAPTIGGNMTSIGSMDYLPHSTLIITRIDRPKGAMNFVTSDDDDKQYVIEDNKFINMIYDKCDVGEKCRIHALVKAGKIIDISNVERDYNVILDDTPPDYTGIFGFSLNDSYEEIITKARIMGFAFSHLSMPSDIKIASCPIEFKYESRNQFPAFDLFRTFSPTWKNFEYDGSILQTQIDKRPSELPYITIWGINNNITFKMSFYFYRPGSNAKPQMYTFTVSPNMNPKVRSILKVQSYNIPDDIPDDTWLENKGGFYIWQHNKDYIVQLKSFGTIFYSPKAIQEVENWVKFSAKTGEAPPQATTSAKQAKDHPHSGGAGAVQGKFSCLQPGSYHADETTININFYEDGFGAFDYDGEESAFNWQCSGNKVLIEMLDTSLPKNERKLTARIANNSVQLKEEVFKRDPKFIFVTLSYKEPGYTGSLNLSLNEADHWYSISLETVREDSGATCNFKGSCQKNDNMLVCADENNNENHILVKTLEADKINLETSGNMNICGIGGNFTGIYAK